MDGLWAGEEWVVVVVPFLAGMAIGAFTVYLLLLPDHLRRRKLQAEIDRLNAELKAYRDQVYQHFRRTSDLFQGLTASYRAVYEHLAGGARALCSAEHLTPSLELPERRLLGGAEAETVRPEEAPASGGGAAPIAAPEAFGTSK